MKHSIPIRIYYEDTDAGGIVYHANYLKFAERGRTEFLRHTGYSNQNLHETRDIMFVVRHIDIDYLKPSSLDDLLSMETTILSMKNSSFVMHQKVLRGEETIADMKVVLVCVQVNDYIPTRLPKDIKEAFQSYQETLE
ncbi:MAG: tol-pal system-associated acyl-CoA thioesterase [Alphaproteobacteria bacterium]